MELIIERGAGETFKNEYTAIVTTSIHIFEDTALSCRQEDTFVK
jgi:hypothetical protein